MVTPSHEKRFGPKPDGDAPAPAVAIEAQAKPHALMLATRLIVEGDPH